MAALGFSRYQASVPQINAHHVAFYNDNLTVNIKGVVVDEPDERDRFVNLRLAAESVKLSSGEEIPVTGVVLIQASRYPEIEYGMLIEANGRLSQPPADGAFNYQAYLARQNIYAILSFPTVEILAEGQANPVRAAILRLKEKAQLAINEAVVDPQAALLSGILLGNDNGIPESLDEAFQQTGMTHIIAISGFNIAIIIWVLVAIGKPFLSPRATAVFAAVGVTIYTILVGADPSVVRAAVMGGFYLFSAYWLGRPTFSFASLFLAGFVLSLHNPQILWDVGFQLSFAATLSIMLYATPLTKWANLRIRLLFERSVAQKLTGIVAETVIVTIAAQLLTLPLIVAQFSQLSLVSLLANVLILPAQPGVMFWGGLTTIGGMISPPIGAGFGWVAWLFLTYTIRLVELLALIPGAAVSVSLSWSGLVVLYGMMAILSWYFFQSKSKKRDIRTWVRHHASERLALGSTVLATVLVFNWGISQPDGRLHIYFLDVGQGDATLIVTPSGRQILVDGGLYPSILTSEVGSHLPFWDKQLDIVVATHPDADHVAGLPELFERYRVNQLITDGTSMGETAVFDAVLSAAENENSEIRTAVAGEVLRVDEDVHLQILHPGEGRDEENRNENSVSMRLTYGRFSYLFTGDAETFGERAMLQSGYPLQSMVFKAGHHGSRTSSSAEFLAAVQPKIMVVSAGVDNRFGHPHPEVLQRATMMGTAVLRTDQLGTIELVTDGEQMWWFSHR